MFFNSATFSSHPATGAERTTLLVIGGMETVQCVRSIEETLRALPGVESVGVNLLTRLSTVRHASHIAPSALAEAVNALGFHATPAHASFDAEDAANYDDSPDPLSMRKARFFTGVILTALIFCVNSTQLNNVWKLLLLSLIAAPAQIVLGWEFYVEFFKALRRMRFNLDSLAVLASGAAFMQGMGCFLGHVTNDLEMSAWIPQFHTASLILTAMCLGKWIEALAHDSATELWGGLEALLPREACVLRDGREQIIPSGAVASGDLVLVGPGERIPVDGEVLEGYSHVDESQLSGEARPISKIIGDRVSMATLNGSGVLRLRATGMGPHSTLARISVLVEHARQLKGRTEVLADRVAAWLAPAALLLAFSVLLVSFAKLDTTNWLRLGTSFPQAVNTALHIMVASCPLLLCIASPLTLWVAASLAARRGILIKCGAALENAAAISDIVFDQGGTLTCGAFRVREIMAPPGRRETVLSLAAALGAKTKQSAAKCIEREARRVGLAIQQPDQCERLPGGGVSGKFESGEYWLCPGSFITGSRVRMEADLAARATKAEKNGATVLFLCHANGETLGAIALDERLKEGAAEAIADLKKMGLALHLMSGESLSHARSTGHLCGLHENEIHALANANGKAEFTRGLREAGRGVAAVGDGASDAPALAAADVGIALGAGADAAVESAQIVLVSGDVRGVVKAIQLARQSTLIIQQNLIAALSCAAGLLLLSYFGKVTPTTAAWLTFGCTVMITLNSWRLNLAYRPQPGEQTVLQAVTKFEAQAY